MQRITTRKGKEIEIVSQHDLRDPQVCGDFVRAYCHIHGGDHQRSLSIRRSTGWGHCFNAACQAVVLVSEWNSQASGQRLRPNFPQPSGQYSSIDWKAPSKPPLATQPILLHLPPQTQPWQQAEQATLQQLDGRLQAALTRSQRAHAYLLARRIPLHIALSTGVGYLPPEAIPQLYQPEQRMQMRRWAARFIFPLVSPFDRGAIGRSIWQWRPGMSEQEHKHLLEQPNYPKRWIKTNPAGWFSCPLDQMASDIILVEGAFDRLALLAAGFAPDKIVALTGTAMQSEWLPPQVKNIILALDSDEGGIKATDRLTAQLKQEGFTVRLCPPTHDRWGKDWSERWQRIGQECTWPLLEEFQHLHTA